jgi:hypothetical protein
LAFIGKLAELEELNVFGTRGCYQAAINLTCYLSVDCIDLASLQELQLCTKLKVLNISGMICRSHAILVVHARLEMWGFAGCALEELRLSDKMTSLEYIGISSNIEHTIE